MDSTVLPDQPAVSSRQSLEKETYMQQQTKYYALLANGVLFWAGAADSPAEAIRAHYLDVGVPDRSGEDLLKMSEDEILDIAGDLESVEIEEPIYRMIEGLRGDDDRAVGIVEQYKEGRVNDEGLRAAIEGVEGNNSINDASWAVWDDASHICDVYGIEDLGDLEQAILNRAIESRGESLKTDLPLVERLVWGQNFAGSWWDRAE
jgi:hypothetical protein